MKCLFCGFISGKRKVHDNRFPFKILDETQNTIAFLSVDFPSTENGHVLVIPKKHFENLEDVRELPRVSLCAQPVASRLSYAA